MKGYLITICIFIMALSISSAQALGTANYNSIVPSQANNQNQNGIGNTYPNGLAYPENELSSMYSNLFNKSMIKGINSHFLANISKNLIAYGIGQSFTERFKSRLLPLYIIGTLIMLGM